MTVKHGGKVYEKDRHQWWDWGQALCREQYGKDWNNLTPDEPTDEDRQRAWSWEGGDIPDWVDTERMILVSKEQTAQVETINKKIYCPRYKSCVYNKYASCTNPDTIISVQPKPGCPCPGYKKRETKDE